MNAKYQSNSGGRGDSGGYWGSEEGFRGFDLATVVRVCNASYSKERIDQ